MATIKSYTDINQSNKLAEILPLESADMTYRPIMDIDSMSNSGFLDTPDCYPFNDFKNSIIKPLPCWSLAALFNILPNGTDIVKEEADTENEKYMCTVLVKDSLVTTFANNPIDVCVELIIKLYLRKI